MGSWESARHRKVGRRRGAAGGGPHGSRGARAQPRWPVHLRPLPSAAMATPIRRRPRPLGVRAPTPFLIATGVGPCGATHPASAGAPRRPRARAIPHCHGRRPLRCDPFGFGHGPWVPAMPAFGLAAAFRVCHASHSASPGPSRLGCRAIRRRPGHRAATPPLSSRRRSGADATGAAAPRRRPAPLGAADISGRAQATSPLATGSEHLRWLRGDRDRWQALGIGAASQVMCTARPIVSMVWSA